MVARSLAGVWSEKIAIVCFQGWGNENTLGTTTVPRAMVVRAYLLRNSARAFSATDSTGEGLEGPEGLPALAGLAGFAGGANP